MGDGRKRPGRVRAVAMGRLQDSGRSPGHPRPARAAAASMNQGEFTGIFCARPQNFAWFLGAGASRTAGLPTAIDIIWDMKRRYYCREENQDVSRQDIQNDAVKQRIQSFVESRGFPSLWSDAEYA